MTFPFLAFYDQLSWHHYLWIGFLLIFLIMRIFYKKKKKGSGWKEKNRDWDNDYNSWDDLGGND